MSYQKILELENWSEKFMKEGYSTWTEFYTDTVVLYSSNDMGK